MPPQVKDRARAARRLFPLIAKRIDSLAAPPAALSRLTGLLDRADLTPLEAAEFARWEPALAAKVLRVVNSPFYGLRHRISTLSHAVAMLGPAAVRRIAGGIPAFAGDPDAGSDALRLGAWRHSIAVSVAAEAVARAIEYELPEEAGVAGLLHDIGRGVLDSYAPADHVRDLREVEREGPGTTDFERRLLGMDHCQVGALMAEQWNFPRILKDAVQFHHDGPERLQALAPRHRILVGIVAAADRLCDALTEQAESGAAPGAPVPGEITLSPDKAEAIREAVRAALARTVEWLGGTPGPFGGSREGASTARAGPPRRRCEASLAERLKLAGSAIREIRRATSMEDQILSAVRFIQKRLDFDRVLFLQLDSEADRLLGRHLSDDTQLAPDVDAISLPLARDGLIGAAFRDGAAVRVDNWSTDGGLLSLLGHSEAIVAPVVAGKRVLGVMCADQMFRNRDLSDADVALLGIVATDLGLVVENQALEVQTEDLRSLASLDELTRVRNRRSLMERLQGEIERSRRYDSPLSVVMVDIDGFKRFNDTFGHLAGDTVLAEVAQLISTSSRDIDVIGRFGGEEFLSVLPETFVDQAIVYAERLRKAVDELGQRHREDWSACPLTISVGVTSLRRDSDDLERLLHRVDQALYTAKDLGRNRVCVG